MRSEYVCGTLRCNRCGDLVPSHLDAMCIACLYEMLKQIRIKLGNA